MSTYVYKKCAKCGVNAVQDNSVKFHRFPKPGSTNILRATAWATYCWPERDWSSLESLTALHKTSKVLCGRHFEDTCYIDSNKKRLSLYSIPGTKEYVIKLMHSLRSKIPSIVKQVKSSLDYSVAGHSTHHDNPVGGTSTQQDVIEAASSTLTVKSSLDYSVAGHSTHHDNPVGGTSTQQDVIEAASSTLTVKSSLDYSVAGHSTHHDNPVGGTSTQQDVIEAASSTLMVNSSLDDPVAGHFTHPDTPGTSKKRKGILKYYLNKNKLSQLSETERKLYNVCKNNLKLIHKLRNKLKGKKKGNKIQKICEDESVNKLFDLKLSNSFIVMLQSQLANCRRKQKGRRYNLEQKLLALTLYKKSPACYRLLRRMFSLPCQSTLNKLLNKVPMKPGINEHIFSGLQAMAETQTEEENLCSLVFDEMAIRKHLNYNPKSDCVDGFQDHGNHGRTNQVACNALVFMLCGLRKKWKQPVAFYLSAKSVTSDRLSVIIKEVLTECFKVGLNVVATVCDLCSVNTKALHNLGTTTETPYFNHDGREIVTIADPPHLLKCLRNMFLAHDIQFTTEVHLNGNIVKGTAKWDHVKQFYYLDKINPHFVYAPALTEKHIKPNAKQKMRVKLAAQVISHTVTAGILAKVATNELPADALATATLLKKFDQLFDSLNANSPDLRRGKKFSTNLTSRSPHLNYFLEMKKFIKDMAFVNARNPPSQSGWIQTLNAMERLWKNVQNYGIKSLSTRRLNQDPLENFFGCVRYNCGSNYNPTISQFIAGFKTAIITNLRHTSQNKNCEEDDALLSNNLKNFLISPIEQSLTQSQQDFTDDYIHGFELDTPDIEEISSEIQACAYVCGFVVKKLNKKCTQCIDLLTSIPGSEPAHLFTTFKEYSDNKNSLNYVSMNLVRAVEKAASLTKSFLNDNLYKQNLREKGTSLLETKCKENFFFLQKCPIHYEKSFKEILHHVFFISLKRFIILKNVDLSEEAHQRAIQRKFLI